MADEERREKNQIYNTLFLPLDNFLIAFVCFDELLCAQTRLGSLYLSCNGHNTAELLISDFDYFLL